MLLWSERLLRRLLQAQPKRLGNQILTGPMLAGLVDAYVTAINNGAVPTIATAWQVRFFPVLLLPAISCFAAITPCMAAAAAARSPLLLHFDLMSGRI
jgi:hypothetical protein